MTLVDPKRLRFDTWELFLIEHFRNNLTKDEILELLPNYEFLISTLRNPGTLTNLSHDFIVQNVNRVFEIIKYPDKIKTFDDWKNLENHWMDKLAEKHNLQKFGRFYYHE